MPAPANEALWLPAKRAAFEVRPAPYIPPQNGEIVIRTHAVAINPIDRMMPSMGGFITPWLTYPAVVGSDVAGEVVEVGAGVTRFRIGDRVLGHAVGIEKTRNRPAEGAFQLYTVLLSHMAAPIPDAMSYEDATVLPLGVSTAACGLFQTDFLGLNPPKPGPKPSGRTLIVWGGSTSVGSNAIQLAVAAGYDVVTTASPRNFDYVRRLGAREAFDYRSSTVVADMVRSLNGRVVAGAIAIGAGATSACIDVLAKSDSNRFIAVATPPASFDDVPLGRERLLRLVPAIARMLTGSIKLAIKARLKGVRTKFIWGGALFGNEVGPMIYEAFLPGALAEGRYVAAPAAKVVGHGLEAIPKALDLHLKGVSATKLVVTL
jgi:NADPH:quinone reductase-like Zn-dependent oxidoreductase